MLDKIERYSIIQKNINLMDLKNLSDSKNIED